MFEPIEWKFECECGNIITTITNGKEKQVKCEKCPIIYLFKIEVKNDGVGWVVYSHGYEMLWKNPNDKKRNI